MALRVDLADILLGEGDVLCLRAGDHDLMVLLVVLLLVLVKIRLILADDVPFHLLGARANVIKNGGDFRRVFCPRAIDPQLRHPQDAATYQRDDQHECFDGSPHDERDGIHDTNCPSAGDQRGHQKSGKI